MPYYSQSETAFSEQDIANRLEQALRALHVNYSNKSEDYKVISHNVTPTTPGRYLITIIYEVIYNES